MLSEKILKALNRQMNAESASAYLYMGMAAWLDARNLRGCAAWMKAQAHEEFRHAMKFYDFINERGGRVILQPVDAPPSSWDGVLDAFQKTLEHERHVTARINDLVNVAIEERDHATNIFLQWFVTEQVEEEDSVNDLLHKLRLVNGEGQGMLLLDKDLAARVFTMPAATA